MFFLLSLCLQRAERWSDWFGLTLNRTHLRPESEGPRVVGGGEKRRMRESNCQEDMGLDGYATAGMETFIIHAASSSLLMWHHRLSGIC